MCLLDWRKYEKEPIVSQLLNLVGKWKIGGIEKYQLHRKAKILNLFYINFNIENNKHEIKDDQANAKVLKEYKTSSTEDKFHLRTSSNDYSKSNSSSDAFENTKQWTTLWMLYGTKYSRMDQVKFVEDSLWKIWNDMVCWDRPYLFQFFKSCLPQTSFGPFLNTLSHIKYLLCSKNYLIKKRKCCNLTNSFLSVFLFKLTFFLSTKSSPCLSTLGKIPRKFVFEPLSWSKVGSFYHFSCIF